MANLTEAECRALLDKDQAFSTSTGDFDEPLYLDVLNELEDQYFDLAIQSFPEEFLVDLGLNSSTLLTNVPTLYSVDVIGGGVFETDGSGNMIDTEVRRTRKGSQMTGVYFQKKSGGGADVVFTPITATAVAYVLRYVPARTIVTAGDDTILPDTKAHFVKRAILRLYLIWDQNPEQRTQDALFQQYLRDIINNSNPDPEHSYEVETTTF